MSVDRGDLEDPDAQATINDYLDYTEHLPSDIYRSLNLIRKLDQGYNDRVESIHRLTRRYWQNSATVDEHRDSIKMRNDISDNLYRALSMRESSCCEAERLAEMVSRHYARLAGIKTKLEALPMPPSRDASPISKSSPDTKPSQEVSLGSGASNRLFLRHGSSRRSLPSGHQEDKNSSWDRKNRRVTVPGEALPLGSEIGVAGHVAYSSEARSTSGSPRLSSSRVGKARGLSEPRHRPRSMTPGRITNNDISKGRMSEDRSSPSRLPGMGTNVHSAVAGISTSNALMMIPKPPANAKIGSEHLPWMRLTEYEMAVLRKRMKKNAIWTPSETMIRRELDDTGRGFENYLKKRQEAERTSKPFIDDDDIINIPPDQPLRAGEIRPDDISLASSLLNNRGIKLNEAKKEKREFLRRATTQETELAAQRIGQIGENFKTLFDSPVMRPRSETIQRENKKRKDNSSTGPDVNKMTNSDPSGLVADEQSRKRARISGSGLNSESKSNLKGSMAAPPQRPSPKLIIDKDIQMSGGSPILVTAAGSRPRRVSLVVKGSANANAHSPSASSSVSTRQKSSGLTGPASAISTASAVSTSSRRNTTGLNSAFPATPIASALDGPSLSNNDRRRRPAPGNVSKYAEGAASVSKGRRERPPSTTKVSKNSMATTTQSSSGRKATTSTATDTVAEDVDPDEPRYCICNDVSWGEMIACENAKCEREWFHFSCVGLTENLPRRTQWYCPDCRSKRKR